MYHYTVYYFHLCSSIPCPELATAPERQPDVVIREGELPLRLPSQERKKSGALLGGFLQYELGNDRLLLKLEEVGQFMITSESITVMRAPKVDDATLRLYLLGTGLGFLLHLNGIFPFHGSSVVLENGQALMFIGPSGAGKSTLAGKFVQEGARLLADDVSVVRFDDQGRPMVWPGAPYLKVWTDSANELAFLVEEKNRIRPELEKFRMPLEKGLARQAVPLSDIFVLDPGKTDQIEVSPLSGMDKTVALISNIYRGLGVEILDRQVDHFRFCTRLATVVPAWRISRPEGIFKLQELYDRLCENDRI